MNVYERRSSCSANVKRLWNAVEIIHNQRQLANYERIRRYMSRVFGTTDQELQKLIVNSLSDGLLLLTKSVGNKGNKMGVEQDGYVLPRYCVRDNYDWYCFECHLGGKVIGCTCCYRVYHKACINMINKREFVCNVCRLTNGGCALSKERLNCTLRYVFRHFNESLPSSVTEWLGNTSNSLIREFLIFKTINLNILHRKIMKIQYSHIEEFKADVRTILHNVIIFEGENSSLADAVKTAISECLREVKELELCADCYQISHEKHNELWFCKPCNPPHELVYAQVKGYPFWPAKVIKKIDDQYDVRFFGGHHQRALIHEDHIKPITENLDKLQKLPKTVSWRKACEELEHYQMVLENGVVQFPKKDQRLIKKRQNNIIVRRKKPYSEICVKRKAHWKKRRIVSFAKKLQKTSRKSGSVASSSPCSHITNVSVQTCCSYHKQHKYTLDFENKEMKFSECNYDTEKMVNHVMQIYKKKKKQRRSSVHVNNSSSHCFHNAYCPLNKFRKNLYSNREVENVMKETMSEASEIIENKYNDLVDRMAEKHSKMLQEIKKKVWCIVCCEEASIHCCWNVDYCSQKCQTNHWENGHKGQCLIRMLGASC